MSHAFVAGRLSGKPAKGPYDNLETMAISYLPSKLNLFKRKSEINNPMLWKTKTLSACHDDRRISGKTPIEDHDCPDAERIGPRS